VHSASVDKAIAQRRIGVLPFSQKSDDRYMSERVTIGDIDFEYSHLNT
jgi:hypothetical protein